MTTVAVSILNHNGAGLTLACIASLCERVGDETLRLDIRVLDNGSQTEDREQLAAGLAQRENVRLVCLNDNRGFAAGHNHNLRDIFRGPIPDYVWLLNNDCQVQDGCIDALLECAAAHPDTAIWGATLLEADAQTIQCAGGCYYSRWLSSYRPFARGTLKSDLDRLTPRPFDYIAGASLFMPTRTLLHGLKPLPPGSAAEGSVVEQWLNEMFFLYFEELDLAHRLKPDLKMAWCRDAMIVHASNDRPSRKKQQNAEFHATLSALKFTAVYLPRCLPCVALSRLALKGARHSLRLRFDLVPPLLRAYREFIRWRQYEGRQPA